MAWCSKVIWIHVLAVLALLILIAAFFGAVLYPLRVQPCKPGAGRQYLIYGLFIFSLILLILSLIVWLAWPQDDQCNNTCVL